MSNRISELEPSAALTVSSEPPAASPPPFLMPTPGGERPQSRSADAFPVCSCRKCVRACEWYPGWMTVAEANAAMDAGLAGSLMRDCFFPDHRLGNTEKIYVLCPAAVGLGGRDTPAAAEKTIKVDGNSSVGIALLAMLQAFEAVATAKPMPCSLLKDGLCSIHDSGFKPLVCRQALICNKAVNDAAADKLDMAPEWDTDAGRATVARWYALNKSSAP